MPFMMAFTLKNTRSYTKLIIEQGISPSQEIEITEHFMQMNGVETARMDRNTHAFLAIYDPSAVNENTITNWFVANGFTVKCYYSDNYKSGNIVGLTLENCK
jgi:hypothetical protein